MKQPVTTAILETRLAVTVGEAAALIGVSSQTVSRMIANGRLAARNVATGRKHRTYVVPVDALKRWIGGSDGR